jgi:hypothetical protein
MWSAADRPAGKKSCTPVLERVIDGSRVAGGVDRWHLALRGGFGPLYVATANVARSGATCHRCRRVKARALPVRGRASSAKAKWQDRGWEFVSENRGTLRTELNFRRAKPRTFGAYLLSFAATFRRSQPKTQLAVVASGALILVAGITGIFAGTQSGGDNPNPSATQTTASTAPPAEPTVTSTTADEPLDESDTRTATPTTTPTAAPTPSAAQRRRAARLREEAAARERARERAERRAKARARARARAPARARVERREQAHQRERQRNTEQLQSGVTCDELGESDIAVNPGSEIDADGDGVGCES